MALSGCEETIVERADGEVMESRAPPVSEKLSPLPILLIGSE
jgi:hypothetical protein